MFESWRDPTLAPKSQDVAAACTRIDEMFVGFPWSRSEAAFLCIGRGKNFKDIYTQKKVRGGPRADRDKWSYEAPINGLTNG